jgi:hypothetical protein
MALSCLAHVLGRYVPSKKIKFGCFFGASESVHLLLHLLVNAHKAFCTVLSALCFVGWIALMLESWCCSLLCMSRWQIAHVAFLSRQLSNA